MKTEGGNIEVQGLGKVKTSELVEELKKREGVQTEYAEPNKDKEIVVNGPAEILIVID